MHMRMYVYLRSSKDPIVIETNLAWALPYWEARKRVNPNLYWRTK